MKKLNTILAVTFLVAMSITNTAKAAPTKIICKDYNCLINASTKCQPAILKTTYKKDNKYATTEAAYTLEILGEAAKQCSYRVSYQSFKINQKEGDIMNGSENFMLNLIQYYPTSTYVAAVKDYSNVDLKIAGREATCKTKDLTSYLKFFTTKADPNDPARAQLAGENYLPQLAYYFSEYGNEFDYHNAKELAKNCTGSLIKYQIDAANKIALEKKSEDILLEMAFFKESLTSYFNKFKHYPINRVITLTYGKPYCFNEKGISFANCVDSGYNITSTQKLKKAGVTFTYSGTSSTYKVRAKLPAQAKKLLSMSMMTKEDLSGNIEMTPGGITKAATLKVNTNKFQNCKNDDACFRKAATKCLPAQVTITSATSSGGTDIRTVALHKITGELTNGNCNYSVAFQKVALNIKEQEFSEAIENEVGWTAGAPNLRKALQYDTGTSSIAAEYKRYAIDQNKYAGKIAACNLKTEDLVKLLKYIRDPKSFSEEFELNKFVHCDGSYKEFVDLFRQKQLERMSYLYNLKYKIFDPTRVSDLKQLQTALEKYHAAHDKYPSGNKLVLGDGDSSCLNAAGFGAVGCASPYLATVPSDPDSNRAYVYSAGPNGETYTVSAFFESDVNGMRGYVQLAPDGITKWMP